MSSSGTRLTVGLLAQGGTEWIAGAIYLQNLIRALHLLPEADRPALYLCHGPRQQTGSFQELGDLLPPIRQYTFRAPASLRSKVKATVRHCGPSHLPTSLERIARETRMKALFPVRSSVGGDFPCDWIGWIPDFQHRRLPEYFSEDEAGRRDRSFDRLARDAPCLVVSSKDTYEDLLRYHPEASGRAAAFPFVSVPIRSWYEVDARGTVAALGLPERFLLYPSQFWMHKNHRCLFAAVRLAARQIPDLTLVCTGRMHDYRDPGYATELLEELERDDLRGRVRCLGLLDRATQVQLIRASVAIVQPSLFEGWSSLLEDAQAFGKPVYVSDIPVHREQDPPDARFFDPASPEDLAELIVEDWKQLEPGPDPSREDASRRRQEARAVDYAHRFLSIVERTGRPC